MPWSNEKIPPMNQRNQAVLQRINLVMRAGRVSEVQRSWDRTPKAKTGAHTAEARRAISVQQP